MPQALALGGDSAVGRGGPRQAGVWRSKGDVFGRDALREG